MKFGPKNPPRRKEACKIEIDGEIVEHIVEEVQIGIIDEVLDQVSRIFDFKLDGDIGEQIRTSYSEYPKEFVEALSKLTGYEEQDVRQWGLALVIEITLDWINVNVKFITGSWNKKKGIFGTEIQEKAAEEKPTEEPQLKLSGDISGSSSE